MKLELLRQLFQPIDVTLLAKTSDGGTLGRLPGNHGIMFVVEALLSRQRILHDIVSSCGSGNTRPLDIEAGGSNVFPECSPGLCVSWKAHGPD